jgi:hypothetical protein
LFLRLVHFDLETAEIVEQRVPVLLIDDPIQIGSVFDQHFCDEEADLFVLKTGRLFD